MRQPNREKVRVVRIELTLAQVQALRRLKRAEKRGDAFSLTDAQLRQDATDALIGAWGN